MPSGAATPAGNASVSSIVRAKRTPSRDFASARNASAWLRVSTQHSVTPGSSSIGGEGVTAASTPLASRARRAASASRTRWKASDSEEDGDRRELERRAIERYPVARPRGDLGKREQCEHEERSGGRNEPSTVREAATATRGRPARPRQARRTTADSSCRARSSFRRAPATPERIADAPRVPSRRSSSARATASTNSNAANIAAAILSRFRARARRSGRERASRPSRARDSRSACTRTRTAAASAASSRSTRRSEAKERGTAQA